jgi:hypothetical protein
VHRLIAGSLAFLVMTGTLLVLPVYAAPSPRPEPVAPSISEVTLGSLEQPANDAVVTKDGEPVLGEPAPVAPSAVPEVGAGAQPTSPAPGDAVGAEQTASPTTSSGPAVPSTGAENAPSSGAELPGIPALTISQPRTAPFSTVGLTWAQDDAVTGVVVQLRVLHVPGGWGEWEVLEQDDIGGPDSPGGGPRPLRAGTEPYFTGEGRGVEVIMQAANAATPQDVRLHLIDPGESPADSALGQPAVQDQAQAAAAMPAIYSRAQWGADESLRTWDPTYSPTVKAATVHHTAGSNSYSAGDVPSILRSIYAYHSVSLGWGDIGYHFLVDKFGRAWEGRFSGSKGMSSPVIGAHSGGFNRDTFGISMMGDYEKATTTSAMVETVAALAAWKLSLYRVDPSGWTTLTSTGGGTSRYAAGESVDVPTIFAHRDVGSTTCPGRYAYAKMSTIRTIASERVAYALAHDPRGSVDAVDLTASGYTTRGWTLDPDSPDASGPVSVSVDGIQVARFTAKEPRPDVAAAYPGAGEAHGFRYSGTLSQGRHTVCVTAENVAGEGNDNVLGCREVVFDNARPRFSLDRFTEERDGTVRLRGWAFDPDGTETRLHVYESGSGRSYGTGVSRPDVAAAYPAAGDYAGFDITVGPISSSGSVCLFVIDTVASGNSKQAACQSFRYRAPTGLIDGVSETVSGGIRVHGWTLDESLPTVSAPVHVYVDGKGISIPSTGSRPDIDRLYPGAGPAHGYDTTVAVEPGTRKVCVFSTNVGVVGPHTLMGCRSITLAYVAPQGVVDSVTAAGGGQVRVRGWTYDRSVPKAPVEVHFYVDGKWHSKVPASADRPDVGRAFPGVGDAHGIDSTLTLTPGTREVCTFAINLGVRGINPLVDCRKVTV